MTVGVKRNLIWLLVLLAVALTWWVWRTFDDNGTRVAANSAWTGGDPDDILVDFKDDIDKADIATIGKRLSVEFKLVSSESLDERFYRAHVPAERRDEILAELATLPSVEIAEPDAEFHLVEPPDELAPGGANVIGQADDPTADDKWEARQRAADVVSGTPLGSTTEAMPPEAGGAIVRRRDPVLVRRLERLEAYLAGIAALAMTLDGRMDPQTPDELAENRSAVLNALSSDPTFRKQLKSLIKRQQSADQMLASTVAICPRYDAAEQQECLDELESLIRREDQLDAKYKGFPNDPQYKYQWHLRQIGMPAAWKLADGKDVIVAVIDTGVAYEKYDRFHRVPDLEATRFVKPYNFVANNKHANDDHGHGTHVAGTIAQNTNNNVGVAGVAPKASIMPLKVLSASGSGSLGAIADAVRYAADNGAKVINMSLGGPFPSKILQKAVTYAHKKGVVVVCAAGNNGRGNLSYPAAYPDAFAVAATQYDETTTFYSNWGKGLDIAAPGGNTKVDQNNDGMPDGVLQNTLVMGDPRSDGYFPYMGTSMAAPHIAGVAALIVAQGVTEPKAVEAILMETARQPKKTNYSKEKYGAGIVDAPAAIKAARKKTGGLQLTIGVLFALAIATHTRRRGLWPKGIGRFVATSGLAASGLFFLPFLGSVGAWLAQLPGISLMTRGVPAMDMALLGPAGHGNVLFYSALIPFVLVAFGYGVARLRPYLAGIAAGVGAHLLFQLAARTTDIQWMALDPLWLAVNAVVCGALAYLALLKRPEGNIGIG